MSMRRVSLFLGAIATVSGCGSASSPADGSGEASSGASSVDGTSGTTGATGGVTSATTADDATASADGSSSGGMTSSNDDAPPPVGFDLGGLPDVPEVACTSDGKGGGGGGIGAAELSYIWIANTYQQPNPTISKIDTVTMLEEGRYQAKPAGGDPSRTSVNLDGDVAVANRNGGVAKFYARESSCEESNGQPGIQTSTGANDVLPWGEEECLAWYLPLACNSNRPLAWTRGEFSELTCAWEDEKLWTVCDSDVLLINGDTGEVEETIVVPGSPFVYGGAADADGNFWGLNTGNGALFRVDFETLELLSWPLGPNYGYGITVDPEGRPWTCGGGGASRFNIDDATWTVAGSSGIGGCMTDGVSTLWHSTNSGLLNGYDIESLEIVNTIQLPEYVHGISVDFQGNVWGVGFTTNNAHRADPMTGQVDTYSGLTSAYTYSDMTGLALNTAGGGGVPPN